MSNNNSNFNSIFNSNVNVNFSCKDIPRPQLPCNNVALAEAVFRCSHSRSPLELSTYNDRKKHV